MNIEISHDRNSGKLRISLKRHAFVALGLVFVGCGLATLSGPWWQVFLEGLFNRAGIAVDTTLQWVLGFVQIAIGCGLVFYKHFVLDRGVARLRSDAATANAFDFKLEIVRTFFSDLQNDHSFRSDAHNHFHRVCTRFAMSEHAFQDEEIALHYEALRVSAIELEEFLGRNFWVYPSQQGVSDSVRYCLAPQFNMDREMISYDANLASKYDALGLELSALLLRSQEAFEGFVSILEAKAFAAPL